MAWRVCSVRFVVVWLMLMWHLEARNVEPESYNPPRQTTRHHRRDTSDETNKDPPKHCHGICPQHISATLDSFLSDYDNRIRPGFGEGPTKVQSYYYVTGFGPASEQDMEYTLDMFFRQRWRDERLAFASNSTQNINELVLNSKMVESVWTPDSFFRNGKKSIAHNTTVPNRLLRIDPKGNILYTMRLTVKAKCPMLLNDFPMDVHTCALLFSSYGYTKDEVEFFWYSENGAQPVDCPQSSSRLNQFELINYTWSSYVLHTVSGDYSVLETKFHLRRQMGYYVIQAYLPCVLIVILSQISFWINKEAVPARTVSGIMTVLSLTTLSISTRQSLPKVAYATALDWYMAVCFGFCFFALIEFATVNYFHLKFQKPNANPKEAENEKLARNISFSCSALRKRIFEIRRGEGAFQVNLNDLFRMASGLPFEKERGYKYYARSALSYVLPRRCLKDDARASTPYTTAEITLAQKVLAEVEEQICDAAMTQGGVSRIDELSRVVFPLAFFLFNGMYWFSYLTHQGHEVAYRLMWE
ncbi:gamma-aminobutyric acid receptor subunit alpha-6-like [Clavelina lepadiformis]|uniref:gamma-aminobutyric acid receptor subunit alpha-6-like n=1 Tax=Clavelina lepadiformis TaxID=159417 RepID=UPI0040412E2D